MVKSGSDSITSGTNRVNLSMAVKYLAERLDDILGDEGERLVRRSESKRFIALNAAYDTLAGTDGDSGAAFVIQQSGAGQVRLVGFSDDEHDGKGGALLRKRMDDVFQRIRTVLSERLEADRLVIDMPFDRRSWSMPVNLIGLGEGKCAPSMKQKGAILGFDEQVAVYGRDGTRMAGDPADIIYEALSTELAQLFAEAAPGVEGFDDLTESELELIRTALSKTLADSRALPGNALVSMTHAIEQWLYSRTRLGIIIKTVSLYRAHLEKSVKDPSVHGYFSAIEALYAYANSARTPVPMTLKGCGLEASEINIADWWRQIGFYSLLPLIPTSDSEMTDVLADAPGAARRKVLTYIRPGGIVSNPPDWMRANGGTKHLNALCGIHFKADATPSLFYRVEKSLHDLLDESGRTSRGLVVKGARFILSMMVIAKLIEHYQAHGELSVKRAENIIIEAQAELNRAPNLEGALETALAPFARVFRGDLIGKASSAVFDRVLSRKRAVESIANAIKKNGVIAVRSGIRLNETGTLAPIRDLVSSFFDTADGANDAVLADAIEELLEGGALADDLTRRLLALNDANLKNESVLSILRTLRTCDDNALMSGHDHLVMFDASVEPFVLSVCVNNSDKIRYEASYEPERALVIYADRLDNRPGRSSDRDLMKSVLENLNIAPERLLYMAYPEGEVFKGRGHVGELAFALLHYLVFRALASIGASGKFDTIRLLHLDTNRERDDKGAQYYALIKAIGWHNGFDVPVITQGVRNNNKFAIKNAMTSLKHQRRGLCVRTGSGGLSGRFVFVSAGLWHQAEDERRREKSSVMISAEVWLYDAPDGESIRVANRSRWVRSGMAGDTMEAFMGHLRHLYRKHDLDGIILSFVPWGGYRFSDATARRDMIERFGFGHSVSEFIRANGGQFGFLALTPGRIRIIEDESAEKLLSHKVMRNPVEVYVFGGRDDDALTGSILYGLATFMRVGISRGRPHVNLAVYQHSPTFRRLMEDKATDEKYLSATGAIMFDPNRNRLVRGAVALMHMSASETTTAPVINPFPWLAPESHEAGGNIRLGGFGGDAFIVSTGGIHGLVEYYLSASATHKEDTDKS